MVTPTSAEFVAVAERAVDDLLRLRPDFATEAGDHRYDTELPDLSDSGVAGMAQKLRGHLEALDAIDTSALSIEERVDAETLRNALEGIIFDAEVVRAHQWDPLTHEGGDPLYVLMVRDTVPLEQRVHGIAGRLTALPDFLATARRTVVRAPHVHAETALSQLPGLRELISSDLDETLGGSSSLSALVAGPREAALTAVDEHEQWLRALVETADADPRLGPDVFERKLALSLDSPLSAEQVFQRASDSLAETTEELYAIAVEFLRASGAPLPDDRSVAIRTALDLVARDAPTNDTVVPVCEQAVAEATEAVRRLGIVTIPPDPMRIEVMPEFRRGIAVAYCDSPGALEEGGVAYVAVSPTPADWSADRVASFYREYNSSMLRNLIAHEAMPGHMLQIAHARRFTGTTRVRKLFSSSSFIEGWAVHAERLMVEAGFGGLPVKLQRLKMVLRTTINAMLDSGVHAQNMSEEEALDLMMRRGFQEEGEAVGKWRRALLTSGQLSTYFVGYTELVDVFGALRPGQSLDDMLAHGNPAPRHLATLLGGS
jgi:uncharacterized protein (DUF885 family)